MTSFDDVKFTTSAPARGRKHGERLAGSLCAFRPEGSGFLFQGVHHTIYFTFSTKRCLSRAFGSTGFTYIKGKVKFCLWAIVDANAALATSAC